MTYNGTGVAVIGCGYWGKNLVRNFHELGALKIVCDRYPAARDIASKIAPGVKVVGKYQDVLDSEVKGVVLATQAETHFDLARQALMAGKDILVEKPLATTYEQGAELVRLADKVGRMIMVGHVLEYHPGVVRLIDLIRCGEIGKIHYIYSNRLSLGKIRREENILWSFAPHDIAVILRVMEDLPLQVTASGGGYVQANIADVTVTNMLFNNGVRAHIFVSWLHPFKEQRLVVVGSKKMISFDDVSKQLVLYDRRVEFQEGAPIPVSGEGQDISYSDAEPLRVECQAFLDAMQNGTPPLTDGQSGLQVLKVLQAAQRSLIMNAEPVSVAVGTFA